MKRLLNSLFSILLCAPFAVLAATQDVQVDLLTSKITTSLKAERPAEALPFFAELAAMEPTLNASLPESFHFYYIDTLAKVSNRNLALSRADIYLKKFGKNGKYYTPVIEIMATLQMEASREAKASAEKTAREEKAARERKEMEVKAQQEKRNKYNEEEARYQSNYYTCTMEGYDKERSARDRELSRAQRQCVDRFEKSAVTSGRLRLEAGDPFYDANCTFHKRAEKKLLEIQAMRAAEWCDSKYQRPTPP